jgi:hypothetical protein
MRIASIICSLTLLLLAVTASANASTRHTLAGRLSGTTKVNVGCPVVTSTGNCDPWRLLPDAQFTITRLNAAGAPVRGKTRTVTSDANSHFSVRLRAGAYLLKPTAGPTTKGGALIHLRVKAHRTTATTVRYMAKYRRV